MSSIAHGWVLREGPRPDHLDRHDKPLGAATARSWRAVLAVLAYHADKAGEGSRPALTTIVEESGYSRRHVLAILEVLRLEGWIEMTAGPVPGRATTHRLCTDRFHAQVGDKPGENEQVQFSTGAIFDRTGAILGPPHLSMYFKKGETNPPGLGSPSTRPASPPAEEREQLVLEPVDPGDFATLKARLAAAGAR